MKSVQKGRGKMILEALYIGDLIPAEQISSQKPEYIQEQKVISKLLEALS